MKYPLLTPYAQYRAACESALLSSPLFYQTWLELVVPDHTIWPKWNQLTLVNQWTQLFCLLMFWWHEILLASIEGSVIRFKLKNFNSNLWSFSILIEKNLSKLEMVCYFYYLAKLTCIAHTDRLFKYRTNYLLLSSLVLKFLNFLKFTIVFISLNQPFS